MSQKFSWKPIRSRSTCFRGGPPFPRFFLFPPQKLALSAWVQWPDPPRIPFRLEDLFSLFFLEHDRWNSGCNTGWGTRRCGTIKLTAFVFIFIYWIRKFNAMQQSGDKKYRSFFFLYYLPNLDHKMMTTSQGKANNRPKFTQWSIWDA